MNMQAHNGMARAVARTAGLPGALRRWLLTRMFGRIVPFLGTAGLRFESVAPRRVVVQLKNKRRVQNHIGGVHAAATALLAETASGFVMGMNVPDDKLLLLKSMKLDYLQRASGDLRAEATLSDVQLRALSSDEKGNTLVAVSVSDATGAEPVVCEMIWAWVPKQRKQQEAT